MKKIRKHVALLLIILIAVMSFSCASIVSKSAYPVSISSTPDGADIEITDEEGKIIHKGKTPTTVTLNAKKGYFSGKDYTVTFTKEGCESKQVVIKRDVDAWYIVGNLLFGGLIGWLIVDPATGAMWTLDKDVSADLEEKAASLNPDEPRLSIISYEDVPSHIKGKLVRIN